MTEKQLLRLQHTIESSAEMVLVGMLLCTVFIAEGLWSFCALLFFVLFFLAAYQAGEKRNARIQALSDEGQQPFKSLENNSHG